MKYIDVHVHVFPSEIAGKVINALETYYGYHWKGTGMLDDIIRSMDEAAIDRCVIFSSATKPAQVVSINNYISSLQNAYPDRFYGFGTMHPAFENYKDEIRRMKDLGLHGMKFHPDFQQFNVDDDVMLKVYELAGEDMPLLFHIGDRRTDFSSPWRLERVHALFPHLKLIAAHLGGYTEWENAWKHLVGKDVYMDISSVLPLLSAEEAKKIVLAHGIDKILFASDYPAVHHKQAIKDVLSLGLSDEDNEKIFYKNAEKLLKITL